MDTRIDFRALAREMSPGEINIQEVWKKALDDAWYLPYYYRRSGCQCDYCIKVDEEIEDEYREHSDVGEDGAADRRAFAASEASGRGYGVAVQGGAEGSAGCAGGERAAGLDWEEEVIWL